jgi:hypothetical protein
VHPDQRGVYAPDAIDHHRAPMFAFKLSPCLLASAYLMENMAENVKNWIIL